MFSWLFFSFGGNGNENRQLQAKGGKKLRNVRESTNTPYFHKIFKLSGKLVYPALILAGLCNVGVMVGDSSVCLDFLSRDVPMVMFAHDTVPDFCCSYVDMGLVDVADNVDLLRDLIVKYSSSKLR